MNWQVIKFQVLKWLRRIVFYGLYGLVIFSVVGYGVLQIPWVQKSLVSKVTDRFSAVSGFTVSFDRFYFIWYDRLEITNLHITDPEQHSMIEAGNLFVNFSISNLLANDDINLDAVSLTGGNVSLITIHDADTSVRLNINVFIDAINKQVASGKKGGKSPKIRIAEVLLAQSLFSYNQTEKDSIRGFDYNHFRVALDEGNLDNFNIIGDTIEFQLGSLQIKDEKTQLHVRQLSTFFRISQGGMEFIGLNLDCNKSHISDTIIFRYNSQADLSDFNNKVQIDARLKNTVLYPEDIAHFTTGLEQWVEPIQLTGHFRGKVAHFTFSPMQASIGSSMVAGSLEMDGLPVIRETFINARLKPSRVYMRDLGFLFPEAFTRNLGPLNQVQLKGNFLGYINDFVADGEMITPFGLVQSDINYKIEETNLRQSAYNGQLKLTNFEIGRFVGDTVNFQKVTLAGRIKGKGFTKESADFTLVGEIPSIGVRGYNYSNIHSNAHFANQYFQGDVTIDDPNLQIAVNGSIDLRPGKDLININARLDTMLLHKLHLSKEEIFLQSKLDIDSRGLSLDSIVGTAHFTNTLIQFRDESIKLDSIRIVSENDNGFRDLLLRSSLVDLSLKGNFYYTTMFTDIERLVHEFMLNIKNDPIAVKKYYSEKRKSEQAYRAVIEANIHDLNPLFQVLDIDLHTSPETKIEGVFSNSSTSNLHFFTRFDSLIYNGQEFAGNEVDFSGSKLRDSTQVLAQLTIASESQQLSKALKTKDLFLEGIWNKDHIDLMFDINQVGYNNSLRIASEVDFLADSTKIKILPSEIRVLGEPWVINNRNYTLVKGQEWSVHNLGITHQHQAIHINGEVSKDPSRILQVDIRQFDMSLLNFFSQEKFKGILNADIKQRDLYGDIFIENQLDIDSLTINNFLVGDVRGKNIRDPKTNHFNIDLTIDRLKNRMVDIKGYYDPKDKENPLHTKAILEKANLKLLEPVVRDLFSQLDGTLTGVYTIEGTFGSPNISGEAKIENGQVMINYLKTLYKVNGTLGMEPNKIMFNDFQLTDGFQNRGRLQGYIAHKGFSKMRINLDASFNNFQVLNTTAKDNSLFYGQAFGTGNLNILGPVSNLKISANARTNKNTRLSIPIGGTTASEERKEFIQFSNFTDSLKNKKKKGAAKQNFKRELSGLTLDFNIDVTPDAYAEIIFDIKSGDIIRGRGRGDINLQIDTKGEFNMFGLLEFTEGAYNFTLYDIINKEFNIKPGSKISWFGDPYQGVLDITASYRQLASMGPILDDQTLINDPNIRRKYPVEVLLKLDGPMLSPNLNFDIDAKDLPDNVAVEGGKPPVRLKFTFNAFKAKLDEQELKRQVFSLIILRKLSPPDAFATGGSLYNSVSELLSNQLSYWLSQVDQNLEIDLDLGTLDQEAFNTFQLRLSYSFLNGRLRVTRDGSFGNQANRSEVSTIAGDWTVDYLLTPDGKFKVKMYSRSSVNQLQNSLNTQNAAVVTGVSLLYTQSFNEFKDLLRSARERRRRELENNPPPTEETDDNKGSH